MDSRANTSIVLPVIKTTPFRVTASCLLILAFSSGQDACGFELKKMLGIKDDIKYHITLQGVDDEMQKYLKKLETG